MADRLPGGCGAIPTVALGAGRQATSPSDARLSHRPAALTSVPDSALRKSLHIAPSAPQAQLSRQQCHLATARRTSGPRARMRDVRARGGVGVGEHAQ